MVSKYLYLDGLKTLAQELKGTEKIHVGIRPYELHAGNLLSIVAYPQLLMEEVAKRGISPKFTLFVSINDWEQESFAGKDIFKYSFDNRPKNSTIKNTFVDGVALVDLWQPKIEAAINTLQERFPHIIIRYIRNSSLQNEPAMRHTILATIKDRRKHKELFLNISGRPTTGEEPYYANVLCKKCKAADTQTTLGANNLLSYDCRKCGHTGTSTYEEGDFWLYHKQLFVARLEILHFDLSISGADHLTEGDDRIRVELYKDIFGKEAPDIKMLFAPVLTAADGVKMSKAMGNIKSLPIETVLNLARNAEGSELNISEQQNVSRSS
jgi:Zn ribbon nucleic-acid-binding protein